MKTTSVSLRLRAVIAALTITILLFTLNLSSIAAQAKVPLRPDHAGSIKFKLLRDFLIVIPVSIDGHGPYNFIFDTATTMTTIDPALARELNLKVSGSTTIITASGTNEASHAAVESISIGEKDVRLNSVVISDLPELHTIDGTIRGILGANVISSFNYLIDYEAKTLTIEKWDEVGAQLGGLILAFSVDSRRMVIPVADVRSKQVSIFVLDSAIPNLVLFKREAHTKKVSFAYQESAARLATNANISVAQLITVEHINIGRESFERASAVLVEDFQGSVNGRIEDGLLPTRLFKSLYINNREGIVMLNPRYNRK